jgi:hypothetical protein
MSLDLVNHFQLIRLRTLVARHEWFQHTFYYQPIRMVRLLVMRAIRQMMPRYIRQARLAPRVVSQRPPSHMLAAEAFCFSKSRQELPNSFDVSDAAVMPGAGMAVAAHSVRFSSGNTKIVFVHAFYQEEAEQIFARLEDYNDYDVILTTSVPSLRDTFLARFDPTRAVCLLMPNVGRDVLGFLLALNLLDLSGYAHFVKIHTKRSGHLADGGMWFNLNLQFLLGVKSVTDRLFAAVDTTRPMLYGVDCLSLQDHMENNRYWMEFLLGQRIETAVGCFIPGTMFLGSAEFLRAVASRNFHLYPTEPEKGQLDGCLPHALERYFGYLASSQGGDCATIENLVLAKAGQ